MNSSEFDIIMGLLQAINSKIDNLQFSLAKVYQAYKMNEPSEMERLGDDESNDDRGLERLS